MSDRLHTAIAKAVDDGHGAQVAFLAELVKRASDNPPGDCAPHAERTAELLEGLGLEVERHPVAETEARELGLVSVTNLIVRHRFGAGPTIALNAHGDVVPPGEGWSVDPYGAEVRDGHMYGRGVAVSKSDFATYAFALLALQRAAAGLVGTVELHFTYDEESGGAVGPKAILEQGLSSPDFAICAGFSYAVVTAHNGCLHQEVEVRGRQAHAATPGAGADALEAANRVLTAIYHHRGSLSAIHSSVEGIDSPTLVVGLIEGGVNTNVVPDRVTLRLDRRLIPEEDAGAVEAELGEIIRAAAAAPRIEATVRRVMLAEPLTPLPGSERLATLLARHGGAVLGTEIRTHGVPLYTDARHYAGAGIPVVIYGAGPRDIHQANAHGADEHLSLRDLRDATEVVARAVADLLG
jgi:acetylornithine deacetylase/succinyl-diaminopimelate desuccinylase family protein